MQKENRIPFLSNAVPDHLFTFYHFLILFCAYSGFSFLYDLVGELQRKYSNVYNQNYTTFLLAVSPVLFYFLIRTATKGFRPGAVFLQSLIAVVTLNSLVPGFHPKTTLPALCFFGLYFCVAVMLKWERNRLLVRRKVERSQKPRVVPGKAINDPGFKRNVASLIEGIRAKRYMEGGSAHRDPSPAKAKKRSALSVAVYELYHFIIVAGFNYAFVLWIQLMNSIGIGRTQFTMVMISLFYPALLYAVLRWLARDILTGSICIHCLLSILLFKFVLPDQTGIFCILFPAAAFGFAFFFSMVKSKEYRKIGISSGQDPRVIDEELESSQRTDRQIEKKFRSKRENSRWYRHSWFSSR